MTDASAQADSATSGDLPSGRTPPLPPEEVDRLFHQGVALFNGVRYWHAHESWETIWRAAEEDDRDFYQGLIQVAAGLLHLERRNLRGARNKLSEGVARLRRYEPAHRGIFVNELIGQATRLLEGLNQGQLPYLISPVIRFVEVDSPDFAR
jgi:uncharacterized protein